MDTFVRAVGESPSTPPLTGRFHHYVYRLLSNPNPTLRKLRMDIIQLILLSTVTSVGVLDINDVTNQIDYCLLVDL